MTTKRFTFTNAETTVKTPLIRDNDVPLSFCEVKDLLNALYEENEQLKSRVGYLERKIQRERVSAMKEHEKWEKEIQKENEQLKQQCKDFIEMLDDMCVAYLINDGLEEILNDRETIM